jgi:DNA-binding response OmpR family regulator
MKALIIHQSVQKARILQKRLENEHIESELLAVQPYLVTRNKQQMYELLHPLINQSHLVIFMIESRSKMLPLHILREINDQTLIPKVILDEDNNEATRTTSLRAGANIYLPCTITMAQLALHLKLLTYKKHHERQHKLCGGDIEIDYTSHRITRNGKEIILRNKEFALLEFFLINPEKVLTRNMILESVWDRNASLLSNTVDVHIARLRRKLGDTDEEPIFQTIYCVGYKFVPRKAVTTKKDIQQHATILA